MEAWNPNIQTVIAKFGPFCVRNVGTRLRDRMTEQTSAEPPPSLPASSEASVRVRTKAVSAAVDPKGKNVPVQTTPLNLADAAPEEQPPPLTEQTSAEQPPSTPKAVSADVQPLNLADAATEGRPTAMPTTLPPAVSAATDPTKQPTLPPSPDTPVELPKPINVELLKLKLQLAKAQSANASAKNDAAVSKTMVVSTTKRMSLTFQRETQAAKKVAKLLPKASHASPIKVTIIYPRTHKHTTHTNLRLFL
jgi:hypothetical protein